jgi:hypothetical protein
LIADSALRQVVIGSSIVIDLFMASPADPAGCGSDRVACRLY